MNLPPIPSILVVLALYALLWCGTMVMIGRLSGWIALGQRFRAENRFHGKCWYFQYAQFRWSMNYSGALTVGADATGLYISIWPMFRLGHPPLLIPWPAIKIEMKRSFWLGDYMEVQFPEVPRTVIRFHERLARRIAATVGPQLAQTQTPEANHAAAV